MSGKRPIFNVLLVGKKDDQGRDASVGVWLNKTREGKTFLGCGADAPIKVFLNERFADPDDIIECAKWMKERAEAQGNNEPDW